MHRGKGSYLGHSMWMSQFTPIATFPSILLVETEIIVSTLTKTIYSNTGKLELGQYKTEKLNTTFLW